MEEYQISVSFKEIEEYTLLIAEWRQTDINKWAIPTIQEILSWLRKQQRYEESDIIRKKIEEFGYNILYFPNNEVILMETA